MPLFIHYPVFYVLCPLDPCPAYSMVQPCTTHKETTAAPLVHTVLSSALFPVSIDFEPAFTMMVDLVGRGDKQWGNDVSAAITMWGIWQAAMPHASPPRRPSVVDALIGSLGSRATRSIFVDVGAGQGLFSLAAASRGHRAIAFEASARSVASLRASVRYNALEALVDLHEVPLGARSETLCLRRRSALGLEDAADVDIRRGYGEPSLHAMSNPLLCEATTHRRTLPEALGIVGSGKGGRAEGEGLEVGALRLSANGYEGWIIDGAEAWMRESPPGVILVEFASGKVRRSGYADPALLLRKLHGLGYTHIAHAGRVCDERWKNLTWAMERSTLAALPDGSGNGHLAHPQRDSTWCRLMPDRFHLLVDHAHGSDPENVLFIHKTHQSSVSQ